MHHPLQMLIANFLTVKRTSGNRPCFAASCLEAADRDLEIRPNASTLANTDCSITKALVALNFDLFPETAHRRYQGQHRIKSADTAFFATFEWAR
jgi:hypothetical protein